MSIFSGNGLSWLSQIAPTNTYGLSDWKELMADHRPSGHSVHSLGNTEDALAIHVDPKYITSGNFLSFILGWSWADTQSPWKLHRPNVPLQHPYFPWLRADSVSVDFWSPFGQDVGGSTYRARNTSQVQVSQKYAPAYYGRYGSANVLVRFTDPVMNLYTDDDPTWVNSGEYVYVTGTGYVWVPKEYNRSFGFRSVQPRGEVIAAEGASDESSLYWCETVISTAPTAVAITNASWSGSVATITAAGHGYAIGDLVIVGGSLNPGGYGGTFVVTNVSGADFTYALSTNPGVYVAGGTTIKASRDLNPPTPGPTSRAFPGSTYVYKNSASFEMIWKCVPENYLCANVDISQPNSTVMPNPERWVKALGCVNSDTFLTHPPGTLLYEAVKVTRYRLPILLAGGNYSAYVWDIMPTFSQFDPKRIPDSIWVGVPGSPAGAQPAVPSTQRLRGWHCFPWRSSTSAMWYAATRGINGATTTLGVRGTYYGKTLLDTISFSSLFEHISNPAYPVGP